MKKIRKGDEVVVLVGKDRGRRGVVSLVLDTGKVVVEGVGRVKRHIKPNPLKGQVGGVVEKEMPIDVSNVALFNKATGKGDRVGVRILEDGRKVRIFKGTGDIVGA